MLHKAKKKNKRKGIYKQKVGQPPGSLVYLGEYNEPLSLTICEYGQNFFDKKENVTLNELYSIISTPAKGVRWINMIGINNSQFIETIGKEYDIHKLVLEDILNVYQRPKIEDFEDHLFIALKNILPDEGSLLRYEHIGIIKKDNTILSFQDTENDNFGAIYKRIYNGEKTLFREDAEYLFYALIDILVDQYFNASEELYDKTEELLEKLLEDPEDTDLMKIQEMMKTAHRMRQMIAPLREVLNSFIRHDNTLVKDENIPYFRDTYDHHMQIIDTLESIQESITGLTNLYLTGLNNKMNEVMKVLTIIATIFIPLTFIAGVYGMNFSYMPELTWKYSYFIVLGIMMILGVLLLIFFRKKKWI